MEDKQSQSTINVVIEEHVNVVSEGHVNAVIEEQVDNLTTDNPRRPLPPPLLLVAKVHAVYFRICLSIVSQSLLWKELSKHTFYSQSLQHVYTMFPSTAFLLLWYLSLASLFVLSFLYLLRCIFHFQIVKTEFQHYVGVNYMFTPWISWLLLLKSAPVMSEKDVSYQILWWFFITPIAVLDVKIYGQWFTTDKRFLSLVANPTCQLSVIGNLVGAWTAGEMGWRESGSCLFTLGMIHYLVVFITLYQGLSGSGHLPAKLRPVLFLFVAAPSMASLAWSSISGSFDTPSKMLFFLSLFLFITLACRPTIFKKSMKRFSITWWSYSFPLTFLTLASAEYAQQVKGTFPPALVLSLLMLSLMVFLCLMVYTTLNVGMLFCDDDDPVHISPIKQVGNKDSLT